MKPIWKHNGIKAHGAGAAKQGWKCYQCEKQCTITTGLNDEPEEVCREASADKMP